MEARMLYTHALTPLHTGTGQSSGVIDLPVAREKTIGWPYLPGSTLKGVLRDACEPEASAQEARRDWLAAFGPAIHNEQKEAGELWFHDARLLCLPVRSYHGSFASLTCPLALERWARDHRSAGVRGFARERGETPATLGEILLPAAASALAREGQVLLEDLDLTARPLAAVGALAGRIAGAAIADAEWRDQFSPHFGIVHDDLFGFLAETATEVVARIRLRDGSKTVATGGLWYEELVPAEAIFACPLVAAPRRASAAALFGVVAPHLARPQQLGGNATVGRGVIQFALWEGER